MVKPVAQQVVVITGASTGIGRASTLAFAARGRGARVVCAARSTQVLDTLVEQIRAAGGTAVAAPTDVADAAAVRSLAHLAEQHFGRIDTWVNGAAVGVWGRVEDITDEEFDRVMQVNFLGHVHGVHAALPALRRAEGGVIIGISSVEGLRAVPLHGPYAASKFALRALLRLSTGGTCPGWRADRCHDGSSRIHRHPVLRARTQQAGCHGQTPGPPVYAPEVVAASIVYAAEHPRREVPVGASAIGFYLGQRLSPALTDALLSVRRFGVGTQLTDRPDNGMDNVDHPMDGPGQVHGSYPGRVLRHSAFTWLIGRRPRTGELAIAALDALRRTARGVLRTGGARTSPPRLRA